MGVRATFEVFMRWQVLQPTGLNVRDEMADLAFVRFGWFYCACACFTQEPAQAALLNSWCAFLAQEVFVLCKDFLALKAEFTGEVGPRPSSLLQMEQNP